MITLYQFAPTWGIPNISPACVKMETYLRMVSLPYEVRFTLSPKGPKGKLPYIEDQGKKIADSRFIIEYLNQTYSVDSEKELTRQERAISNAMQRMIEDDLYWAIIYTSVNMPKNWVAYKQALFYVLPPIVRDVVAVVIRRRFQRDLIAQGTGRHSQDEVFKLAKIDLTALSDFLADKPYFMGEKPTLLDACAFGFLINVLWRPLESPLKEHGLQLKNLVEFCARMKEAFFKDDHT